MALSGPAAVSSIIGYHRAGEVVKSKAGPLLDNEEKLILNSMPGGAMTIDHLMRLVRHAAALGRPGPALSGRSVGGGSRMNQPDWLADKGYTIAQALDRLDEGDAELLPRAEMLWRAELDTQAEVALFAARANQVADLFRNGGLIGN